MRGKPSARLVPLQADETDRKFGTFKGWFEVPEDFDAPFPDELLDAFEGKLKRTRRKK